MSLEFRIIPHRIDNASFSLAIDSILLSNMDSNLSNGNKILPIFRTYQFAKPSVILGYMQDRKGRYNQNLGEKRKVELTMRDTGGGHMYFSQADFHFSLIAPISLFSSNLAKRYIDVNSIVVEALVKSGYPLKLGNTSIRTEEDKFVAGTAQRCGKDIFMIQGGILVSPYNSEIFSLLEAREDEVSLWNQKVDSLSSLSQDTSDLPFILAKNFQNPRNIQLSEDEISQAKALQDSKYANPEWFNSGTKQGDICLISGRNSTKGKLEAPFQ